MVKALKNKALTSSQDEIDFQIERYNPQFNGYHLLANTSTKSESQLLDMQSKYDFHSNGATLNMYQQVRKQQLERMCRLQDLEIHRLDWAECLTIIKETSNFSKFSHIVTKYLYPI